MTEPNLDNPEKQGNKAILLWIFIILLVAINGVLLYMNFKNKDEIEVAQKEKVQVMEDFTETKAKLDSISDELDLRIVEVRKLGGDVESLIKVKEQLEKDKNSIKGANRLSLSKYEEKITTYETLLVNKDKEIEHLKGVNDQLYTENTKLKTQKNELNDSISNIAQEKQQLTEKVAIASVLKAENLAINAINAKGKERDGGEYKAKQVEKIKITFNIADNPVAKIETKEIMMRLIEPDGSALYDTGTGGGAFKVDGQETYYTAKQEIMFDNAKPQVSFVYSKGTPYKQGKHTVELYADGFKIGSGSFVVK